MIQSQVVREGVELRGVQHVIVDNLQFLVGCQESASQRWLYQDRVMAAFRTFATNYNCHVTLIVHPRKVGHSYWAFISCTIFQNSELFSCVVRNGRIEVSILPTFPKNVEVTESIRLTIFIHLFSCA